MMKINDIEVFPRYDQLRSILSFANPKKRLVNEWKDAPTEVDTSEPLLPEAHPISEVIGVWSKDIDKLMDSLKTKDYATLEIWGRTMTIRTRSARYSIFSDNLCELSYEGVMDKPMEVIGKKIVDFPKSIIPLDGTTDPDTSYKPKTGFEVAPENSEGSIYISRGEPIADRSEFYVKCLCVTPVRNIWTAYDMICRAIFNKKTRINGIEAEYTSSSTTYVSETNGVIRWEFNLNFKTL